jgi:hypothetical protein
MGGKCVVISNANDEMVEVKIVCSALNEINPGFVRTYLACVCASYESGVTRSTSIAFLLSAIGHPSLRLMYSCPKITTHSGCLLQTHGHARQYPSRAHHHDRANRKAQRI